MDNKDKVMDIFRDFKKTPNNGLSEDWGRLSEVQRRFFKDILDYVQQVPKPMASEIHDYWLELMLDDGWVYAPTLDVKVKEHPLLMPYKSLSKGDRTRYRTFFLNK